MRILGVALAAGITGVACSQTADVNLGPGASPTPTGGALPDVSNFAATTDLDRQIELSWTVPADPRITGVVVRRAEGMTCPAVVADGDAVAATGTSAPIDTNLKNSTAYCYRAFTTDDTYFSTGVDTIGGTVTSGTLDTTFDLDGRAEFDTFVNQGGYGIAVDGLNRILVSGFIYEGGASNARAAVWRYDAAGTPDTSFDDDGVVVDPAADLLVGAYGQDVVIGDTNQAIVVGVVPGANSTEDFAIWAYNEDGSEALMEFDDNGSIDEDESGSGAVWTGTSVAVAGYSSDPQSAAYWRYTGSNQDANSNNIPGIRANAITLDSTNNFRWLAGGNSAGNIAFWSLDSADQFQSSFMHSLTGTQSVNAVVFEESTSTLLMTGADDTNLFIARFELTGDNVMYEKLPNSAGYAITTLPDGRILVAGRTKLGTNPNPSPAVWCFTSQGVLDTRFGPAGDGRFAPNLPNVDAAARDIAVDANGLIVVTGETPGTNKPTSMALWRLFP